jgi:hypothetical protein
MMSLQPLELRDYHLAGQYQRVAVLVGKVARQKSLGKAPIGGSFLCRIARSSNDQPVGFTLPACSTRSVGPARR